MWLYYIGFVEFTSIDLNQYLPILIAQTISHRFLNREDIPAYFIDMFRLFGKLWHIF
jgi:hypothetical protein